MIIPWYVYDERFQPGTVADVGHSLRLRLLKPKTKSGNEWRLYMEIRTSAADGAGDRLTRGTKVAVFKKCKSLQEAQFRADDWFRNWRSDLW